MTDPFTPADVAAVIQAARVLGRGGAGPLPKLSEDLSRIANKVDASIREAARPDFAAQIREGLGMPAATGDERQADGTEPTGVGPTCEESGHLWACRDLDPSVCTHRMRGCPHAEADRAEAEADL